MGFGRHFYAHIMLVILVAAPAVHAGELERAGAWRVFTNAESCWATTYIKGTNDRRTGGKIYASASLPKGKTEPEISLTIGRTFPAGQAVGLLADATNIPLFIAPPQSAFPQDNAAALAQLKAAERVLYLADGKGYVMNMDGFVQAIERIKSACQ